MPTKQTQTRQDGPEWVKKGPRIAGKAALLAVDVSDDGKFLAVGGGDRLLHIFDAHSHELIQVKLLVLSVTDLDPLNSQTCSVAIPG